MCTQEGQAISGVDNVLVTAASRGIIQREHQRGALFYKNYSQANPFDHVTKDDLDAYRREVERKEKRRKGRCCMLYVQCHELFILLLCKVEIMCCRCHLHCWIYTYFGFMPVLGEPISQFLPLVSFFLQMFYKRNFGDICHTTVGGTPFL